MVTVLQNWHIMGFGSIISGWMNGCNGSFILLGLLEHLHAAKNGMNNEDNRDTSKY